MTKGQTLDMRRVKSCTECGQRFGLEAAFCPFDGCLLTASEWDASTDPLAGKTIDARYRVEGVLGEGGMGKVYRVRHVALDRPFALKALRADLAREGDLAERFILEAKTTASVRHPNIVSITDFGKLPDETPYFVMELLTGQTLAAVIQAGGPVPAARAVRIIRQIAGALGAAHTAGIVHRDLKPENVFLIGGILGNAADDVRVVDFGAAKILGSSRLTKTGIVFGTPHYMSPEQASGAPVDHRADLYALGIIMYEMFTGRVPFEADTYMGVLTQHMFVNPVPPSQVNPAARELGALEEITLRCLEKKPEDRFATMEDLVKAIDEVVQFDPEGRVSFLPHLDGASPRQSRMPPRFRMADELEPPTLEEMRAASDSTMPTPRTSPWIWIGVAGVVLAIGIGGVVLATGSSTPAATAPSTTAPPSTTNGRVIPPPVAMSAPPTASIAPLDDAADAAPAKTEPKRPPIAAAVAPTLPKPTNTVASQPTAPPPRPQPKCDPDDPFCKH